MLQCYLVHYEPLMMYSRIGPKASGSEASVQVPE
jgi:hypothetical protein